MSDDVFDFQGWDAIEAAVHKHAATVGYVTLVEKVQQPDGMSKEETVDSFDFDDDGEIRRAATELRDREPSEGFDDIPDADDEPEPDDPDDGFHEDEPKPPPKPTRTALLRGILVERCLVKLKQAAQDNIIGERSKVYMVRVMLPKGQRMLKRAQFTLRNLGPANDDRPTPAPMVVQQQQTLVPPASGQVAYDAPIGFASVRAFDALAHHYEGFGTLVFNHAKRTLGLEAETNQRLHAQLTDAYKQIDTLTAHIITLRSMTTEEDKKALQNMSSAERSKLATTAIEKVSDMGKAFMMSRGLSETAIKLLNLLGNDPKIRSLMDRSDVVEVLSDPKELEAFGEGLYQIVDFSAKNYAARKAAAAQAAASSNNDGAKAP